MRSYEKYKKQNKHLNRNNNMYTRKKIKELEDELSRTKYNKRTQGHIGLIKAKIALLKEKQVKRRKGKGKTEGYTVRKSGDATVIMVGFPSEDEEAFVNTKKLLADLPVSYYHVFTYSDRKGTTSYKMSEKVAHDVKKMRTSILIQQGERKKRTFYDL